jgi:hypothetical protein
LDIPASRAHRVRNISRTPTKRDMPKANPLSLSICAALTKSSADHSLGRRSHH